MRGCGAGLSVRRMSPWTSLGVDAPSSADAWPSSRVSLILVGDDSDDARVLAALLARATDGTVLRSTDDVGSAIRRRHPGLVVVRSSRRGVGRREAEQLVRNAPCPVAVAPAEYAEKAPAALRRIGVAFDGWEESRVALAEAAALVEGGGGELVVLMASNPHTAPSAQLSDGDPLAGHRAVAARYLRTVVEDLSGRIEVRGRVLDGVVAHALADACDADQLDLLALGSRRGGPVARIAVGSVSSALLHQPPECPLLVCPRGVAPPPQTASLVHAGGHGR
jgi:nucleotide-binding universal stress UspA family protein